MPAGRAIDHWDLFRWPESHEALIKKLVQSNLTPSGRDNYRKVMITCCNWASGKGKSADTGRWRAAQDFPLERDSVFERSLQRTATIWSDFRKHTTNPALVQREDEENATLELEK